MQGGVLPTKQSPLLSLGSRCVTLVLGLGQPRCPTFPLPRAQTWHDIGLRIPLRTSLQYSAGWVLWGGGAGLRALTGEREEAVGGAAQLMLV